MSEWATRAKASINDDGPTPEPERDHLHFSPMLDNSWKLDGLLTGEKSEVGQGRSRRLFAGSGA